VIGSRATEDGRPYGISCVRGRVFLKIEQFEKYAGRIPHASGSDPLKDRAM
jgi:hypothetical protein